MNPIKSMKATSQFFQRFALLLGATTFLFPAWAQNQATLTPIGQWPEYPLLDGFPAVRVAGSYAYVAGMGHPLPPPGSTEHCVLRLLTLDVSTPSQPQYLSHLDTPVNYGQTISMEIRGDYAYVATGFWSSGGMLAVFNLSQRAAPRLVGTYPLAGAAYDLCLAGNHLYVPVGMADHNELTIIDITNPTNPVPEASVYPEGWPQCVSVVGDYAYAGGNVVRAEGGIARVDIIDATNPSQAIAVGGFDIPEYLWINAVTAQDSLLHIAYGPPNGYEVFDLSDPLNPSSLARYELPWNCTPDLIRVVGNLVYLWASDGLRIFDVTDPSNPQLRAFVRLDGSNVFSDSLDIAGQFAYCHAASELLVLNVQDPAAPFQIGQFDTGVRNLPLCVEGGLAFLLDVNGKRLRVLNVSNPRTPSLVSAKDLASAGPFKVVAQRGYVAAGDFLQILDFSSPSQPVEAGRFNAPSAGVDVVGTRAYVTGSSPTNRLTIVEATNPAVPVSLGYLNLSGPPGAPQVVGNFAYYQADGSRLVVVDIRDPSRMAEVGHYDVPNLIVGFQVVGQCACLLVSASDERSVHVVNLADPPHPTKVGRYVYDPATVDLQNLYVSGRCAFVVLSEGGTNRVDILDMGNPVEPVKAGEYYPGGQISGFAMVGNTLYASSDAGLTVLNFFDPNSPLRLNVPVLSGNQLTLSWTGGVGIKLQKTTSLTAPDWQDVPGSEGVSQIELLRTNAAAFFRLFKP